MLKKIIIPTALAGALFTVGQTASANEVDFDKLAQQAKNNDAIINEQPIQEGAYDYNFTRDNINYHFYSDGTHFGYEWKDLNLVNPTQDHLTPNPLSPSEKIDKQQQLFDTNKEYANYKQEKQNEQYVLQKFNDNKQSSNVKPKTVSAPVETGGSVKEQFLANGGTEAMWQAIVLPESNGNPNAVNPHSGAYGLFQGLNKPWANGSVATQTKGAIQYAKDRYGSVENAIAFRNANNWW